MRDDINLGSNIFTIHKSEECTIYKMNTETGYGTMKLYNVFDGVDIMYNDFHMENCFSEFKTDREMLCIEYCKEGRIEWEIANATFLYLGSGGLRIDNRKNHGGNFYFPLKHYNGITISFDVKKTEKSLQIIFKDFPVRIRDIQYKFCKKEKGFIINSLKEINDMFLQLYSIPEKIKTEYFKVKVFEILLYLSAVEITGDVEKYPYFYKIQVEKVKSIEKFITLNFNKHYTLNELSVKFDISLTTMKNCFKGVFGTSIYAYIKEYRMNCAAGMLRKTEKSIIEIASLVGYESQSKFSVAFKQIIGQSPLKYRKSIV